MRRTLLVPAGFLICLCAMASAAHAVIVPSCEEGGSTHVFAATGSVQTYDVPEEASTVLIEARGAAGGDYLFTVAPDGGTVTAQHVHYSGVVAAPAGGQYSGGLGAFVVAEVPVTGGTTLNVIVGAQGQTPPIVDFDGGPGGGGGASAVYTMSDDPLVIAGGGGGAGISEDGDNGQFAQEGSDGGGTYGGAGGADGYGGGASTWAEGVNAGGGGGWFTAGETSAQTGSGEGGHALSGDAAGGAAGDNGADGGYGGGGGSAGPGGGGGGGASGGGGGYGEGVDGGGGGGSFVAEGSLQSYFEVAASQDDGQVTICVGPSSVPAMPWASLALLALGLLAAGIAALKRLA